MPVDQGPSTGDDTTSSARVTAGPPPSYGAPRRAAEPVDTTTMGGAAGWTIAGTLIPGLGLWRAGHRVTGGLIMAAQIGGGRDRRPDRPADGRADQLRLLGPGPLAPGRRHPAVDLPVLRRGLPREDARLPVPRLDARRLSRDAAAGAGRVLGDPLQGRRLRLPARGAADLPGR